MRAFSHQRSIFLSGAAGKNPVIPADYESLRDIARRKLPHNAFTYIDGGAGTGATLRRNTEAFADVRIVPRMLQEVDEVELRTRVFGVDVRSPVFAAPVGVLRLAHSAADIAVARACRECKVPMMVSSQASTPLEDIAKAAGDTTLFYQLYWGKSEELARSFVRRAEASGYSGIVLTLDTTVLGWRTRNLDEAYVPFSYARGIAQYTSDPVFQELVKDGAFAGTRQRVKPSLSALRTLFLIARNYPGSTYRNLVTGRALSGVRTFTSVFKNPLLSWDHIRRLREWTTLPIVLKGIISVDDAWKAREIGVDGIVVSNHGGRQIDGSISSFEMLEDIVKAAGPEIDVVCDSGIRTGVHVFKCLAQGAKAVMVGRPYAFALGVAGQKGVEQYFNNLISEFELTMLLAGCPSIHQLTSDYLTSERS